MKHFLLAGLIIAALSSGTVMAKPVRTTKIAAKTMTRSEKARRQIAADLHARGSNIPPAFSPTGQWSR